MGTPGAAGALGKIQEIDSHLTFPPVWFTLEERAAAVWVPVRRPSFLRIEAPVWLAPYGRFPHATQNRRVMVVLANVWATSGKACWNALVSMRVVLTSFQVTRYSPA